MEGATESVTKVLSTEHQTVLKVLEEFESALESEKIDTIRKTVDFFENRLVIHRRKEEEVLFVELEKYLSTCSGPVACMLNEHRHEKEMVGALKSLLADHGRNMQEIRRIGTEIIQFLRNHIWKEDNVLFPIAEKRLSADEKKRVSAGLEKIGCCCEKCGSA